MTSSRISLLVLACGLAFLGTGARAADPKLKLNRVEGPATVPLGKVARIEVPVGYVFIDGDDYRKLQKLRGEPVNKQVVGSLHNTNQEWAVVFEFADIGYVKDDEKLDTNALLESYRRGTAAENERRQKRGEPSIEVIGWDIAPNYNPTTHNLEWAIRGAIGGQPILNYNTKMLGRKGVMEVILIVEPAQLAETLPTFRNLMSSYSYQTGESYAEFRPGDKIAKLGLGALVVGGAAIGAAKLGLFAWLAVLFKKGAKLIVLAFVAVAAFFRKLFSKLTGRDRGGAQTGT